MFKVAVKSLNARRAKRKHHKQRLALKNKEVFLKTNCTSMKYWFLYMGLEKFGILTFHVSLMVLFLFEYPWRRKTLIRRGFILKLTERRILSEALFGIPKITIRLRDSHIFMRLSVEIFNVFVTLGLKQFFRKTKTFLSKME